jgi:RND family efflux transporter MFP subunit
MTTIPAARAGNGTRTTRAAALIGGAAIAVVALIAGRSYKRPEPVPEEKAPGMTVGSDSLTLAPNAPEWSVVATKNPDPPEQQWTAALPARVVFDESHTSRLGAPLAGRVSSVYVERGQAVKAGQQLYTVSSPNVAELRSDREKALVEQKTAKANLDRIQSAVEAQVLPGKDLVAARQQLAQADLAVKLADEKLQSLKVSGGGDTASFTVTAPRNGVVVEKTVALGQTVSPDSGSLIAIADLSDVWIVADLFGPRLSHVALGTRAKVLIGQGAEGEREGTIDQISAVVDPERHAVPVRIKLANPDGELRPNAYVQVRLIDPTPTTAVVPASAVMSDGKDTFVYIENPKGVLRKRVIEVGAVINGRMPVLAGLSPSERVVVNGVILVDNEIALDN